MINHFIFNGTSTAQLGLIVSGVSIFGAGSRKVEKAGIPGRNGDLQIELGGFNNYTVRYTVSITKNFTTTAQQIREWLLESKGYCELTDTYHPDEIRKACFNSDIEFTTSMLYKYGQASIQFDCLPERYLTTNTPITTTATADTTTDTTMSLSTVPTPINISLNGNTTQEGSSGKNKLPIEAYTGIPYNPSAGTTISPTAKPAQWTNNGNGTFKMSLTSWEQASLITAPLTAGRYVARVTTATAGMIIGIYVVNADGTANRVSALKNGTTANEAFQVATTLTQGQYFAFYIAGGSGECTIKEPMVEAGSTATSYEPHISPTNPQPIHSVSGDNTINVTSKNIAKFEEPFITANANYTHTDNSINISASGTYARVGYSFKVQTGKQYSISFKAVKSNGSYGLIHVDNNNSWNNSYGGFTLTTSMAEYTKTLTANTDILFIGFYVTSNMTTGTMTVNDFMIEVNSTATTYEPYTVQPYPLYLPVENYFDINTVYADTQYFTIDGDSVTSSYFAPTKCYIPSRLVGKKCTFQAYIYSNPTTVNMRVRANVNGTNTDGNYIRYGEEGISSVSFTPTSTSDYVHITYSDIGGMVTVKNIMLSEGNLNHYNRYGNPSIELNKIGTYQDYIYKNGSKWYVHKETGEVDLGTLTWAKSSSGNKYSCTAPQYRYADNMKMFCTAYTFDGAGNSSVGYYGENGTIRYYYSGGTATFELYVHDERGLSASDFKNAVSGVILVYLLRTTTDTEITDTTLINQLNNIEKAYSYNGTTNILQVSNDNGFMLGVVSLHGSTFNSNYKGEPIITVNSTGLIYLNGEVMEVLSAPVTINCQTMQCYNGVINMNNEVRVNDFPEIKIGVNEVGSSMALTITPNNWRH